MVTQDLTFLALTVLVFAFLVGMVKSTERLRQGASDE